MDTSNDKLAFHLHMDLSDNLMTLTNPAPGQGFIVLAILYSCIYFVYMLFAIDNFLAEYLSHRSGCSGTGLGPLHRGSHEDDT